jgi:hypothetical protein
MIVRDGIGLIASLALVVCANPFGTLEYNEKAATEARSEIEQFLRQ